MLGRGRGFVALDDIRAVVQPVLRHRLQPGYEAEAQGLGAEQIIERLLAAVQVPAAGLEQDRAIAGVAG